MPVYHSNSIYGKLTAILNSDKCVCGNSKKAFTPFCKGCYEELEDGEFPTKRLYRSGEGLLEAMIDGIHDLRMEDRVK